jgi:hypothetical protein
VRETQPVELRKRGEEVLGELGVDRRPLLELGGDAVAVVADGVPVAPEDALVLREPVVVESILFLAAG